MRSTVLCALLLPWVQGPRVLAFVAAPLRISQGLRTGRQGVMSSTRMLTPGQLSRRAALATIIVGGIGMGVLVNLPDPRESRANAAQRVGTGGPPFSKSGYDLSPLSEEEVETRVDKLTALQKQVLTQAGTERPFQGKTVNGYPGNVKDEGTWVSAVSGVPLFGSDAKYDSGTGWPSFFKPIDPDHIVERKDPKDAAGFPGFFQRTEVLDRKSGTHLGHVFDDGPPPTKKRYCMNAAAMAFIPKEEELPVKPSFKP